MNDPISTEQAERKTFLLAEQMHELQEYATEFREESKRAVSSQEQTTAQLRDLQDEINSQANELQGRRSDLVREEARLQQWKKSLQEEKSAWAATKRYAAEESTSASAKATENGSDSHLAVESLQLRKNRLQQYKRALSETRKDIEQQIEDWKHQVETQNEAHHSRKIAFEKRLSSIAQWEENIGEREEQADVHQEELAEYESELALKEHDIAATEDAAPVETQEDIPAEPVDSDNELNIDFGALFEDDVAKKEDATAQQSEKAQVEETESNDVRSALADMFDLSADQLADENKPDDVQSIETKPEPPQMIEVELESARFFKTKPEPTNEVVTASVEPESVEEKEEPQQEESVSDYMERLLARTKNGNQDPAPVKPIAVAPTLTTSIPDNEEQQVTTEDSLPEVELPVTPSEPKHKQNMEEVRARRNALRELANLSARTNIAKYTTDQIHIQLILKYVLTGVSFVVAGTLLTSQMWGTESYFTAGLVALGVFGIMGMELLRTLVLVRRVNSVDGDSVVTESLADDQAAMLKHAQEWNQQQTDQDEPSSEPSTPSHEE